MSVLFDRTLAVLGAGLTARSEAQGVIAGNVANADTPGFRARRVDFSEALARVARGERAPNQARTDARHFEGLEGAQELEGRVEIDTSAGRVDGNNVVLEDEVSAQVANAMEYQALTTLARRKFGMMRYALDHGGR